MLSTANLIGFIATTDPARARAFYETILGLELAADEPFALLFNSNGTQVRVQKVESLSPAAYTALGWSVQDIGAEVEALTGRGVTFEKFPGLPQDDRGISAFPDGAQVAWFKDPDGNLLSLTQFPPG
jgi:catechol 2,3-dioxygenase-like lactoylglutathione lyase family enzyme